MGKARQINIVAFAIRHQGAELLGAEGENFGVLAISKGVVTTSKNPHDFSGT